MSKQKKQCYVVIKGHNPGIYANWFGEGGAAEQVVGFDNAIFKGFYTREEALNWLKTFPPETLAHLAPNLLSCLEKQVHTGPTLSETIADMLTTGKVVMFTDGSVNPDSGVGGYGVILKYKDQIKELSGAFRKTTNNRMELMACIEGLRVLKKKSQVVIFSDSQYVVNSISKGWAKKWQAQGWRKNKKEFVENSDLWAQLLDLCDQHSVEFYWIRGHNSIKEN